jgi:hypothetical protein
VSICAPKPIFVEPLAIAESPAPKTGCSASSGSWLLALVVLLRTRRR